MKKTYCIQSIPYVCILLSLGIATFFDLSINTYVYHPNNLLALFFERFVLFPITLCVPIAFFARYKMQNSYFSLLAYGIGSVYVCLDFAHFWVNVLDNLIWLMVVSMIFLFLFTIVLQRIPISFWKQYERYLAYVLCVFLISMGILLLLKWGWGRVRYRDMLDDFRAFTPWYLPQGYRGHMSFPSGHTTAMSVLLCWLDVHRCKQQHPPFWWQYTIIFALIIAMMISRMVLGAHFLSDVTMGFCITYTVFLGTRRRFYREVRR